MKSHAGTSTTIGKPGTKAPAPILIAVAVAIAVSIYAQGLILVADVLLVTVLPLVLSYAIKDRILKWLWIFAFLWAAAELVSDIIHHTQIGSVPTFIGPTVALLATGGLLLHDRTGISAASILMAVALGWIVLEIISGNAAARGNIWKYGLVSPVALFILAFAYRRQFTVARIIALLVLLAGFSLAMDGRFATGLFLGCAFALAIFRPLRANQKKRSRAALVALLLAFLALYVAYPSIAMSGLIGNRAYEQQVQYDADGSSFLFATRMELPQMAVLVTRHPGTGIGAYGKISAEDASSALEFINSHIEPLRRENIDYLLATTDGATGYRAHSAALASALYAGVLALPFWLFLLAQNIRALSRLARGNPTMPAIVVMLTLLTTWDMLFSPLNNRTNLELAITFFVVVLSARNVEIPSALSSPSTQKI